MAETENTQEKKKPISWYKAKMQKGTITTAELEEFENRLNEEIEAAKKRKTDLSKLEQQRKRALKQAEHKNRDKKALALGHQVLQKFGDDVTVERISEIADVYYSANNNINDKVKEMLEKMAAYKLNNGSDLYNWTKAVVGYELMEEITAAVGVSATPAETEIATVEETDETTAETENE